MAPSLFSITANCRFKFMSTKQDVRITAIIYTELSFHDAAEMKRKRCTSPQLTKARTEMMNISVLANCSGALVSEDLLMDRPFCHVCLSFKFYVSDTL
jgi:hypothetical protein